MYMINVLNYTDGRIPGVIQGVMNGNNYKLNITVNLKQFNRHFSQLGYAIHNTLFEVKLPDLGNTIIATARGLQCHPGFNIHMHYCAHSFVYLIVYL